MEITTVSNDTVEDATKAFNGWQAEILNAFGAQIERTNTLMQQLIESINSEKLLLEQHNELVGKGPSLVARLVLARQKDLSNQSAVPASFTAPAIYDSTMEASWKVCICFFFVFVFFPYTKPFSFQTRASTITFSTQRPL